LKVNIEILDNRNKGFAAMDLEQARTFLSIVEAGTFLAAAERLNVTQSTVSMRVRSLEAQLGQVLFRRGRGGIELTAAGQQFHRYAAGMVRLWNRARQDVALPQGVRATLAVGGPLGLWDRLLQRWIGWMREDAPDVALRAEAGTPEELMLRLAEGHLDLAVMYSPTARTGLTVAKILEERLILVATDAASTAAYDPGYVFVDWGPEFQAGHARAFPDLPSPLLAVNTGLLGLRHILAAGGAGYFPRRIVREHLESGRLHAVTGAPEFARPAFAVHPAASAAEPWFARALAGLDRLAAEASED